ncbi:MULTISPECIES: chemotaxis protein CheW [Nostocales]|uniref:Chemotaxis protein CheW n=3 Tax=Nostocales TaxID=1161 RepID=A0A0C1NE75_9CYAN|nr:chemotaxis protein CheW [Tolypothrix bouteillei]KAF3887933.1 chemotaxis protein CheW [Tolypothrix bouteillei VB521301]
MLPSLDSVLTTANLSKSIFHVNADDNRQRFLSFPIGTYRTSLIPLEQITEILRINLDEVLSVPETPDSILGVYNWRGEMLWLVDLEQLIGGTSLFEQVPLSKQPIAIVLQADSYYFGLVVKSVNEIELHDINQLLAAKPGSLPPQLLPFVIGYLPNGSTVLNQTAIAQFFL